MIEFNHAESGEQGQQTGEKERAAFKGDQDDDRQQDECSDQAFYGLPLSVSWSLVIPNRRSRD